MPADAYETALAHHRAGRLREAEAGYREILARAPNTIGALNNLAVLIQGQGRLPESIQLYHQALSYKPDFAEAHCNLGNALRQLGRLDDAMNAYRRALSTEPRFPDAARNLGNALRQAKRPAEAIAPLQQALSLRPDWIAAAFDLGNAFYEAQDAASAHAAYDRVLALQPTHFQAAFNKGNLFRDMQRSDDAKAAYHAALRIQPDSVEALTNLASVLKETGELNEAISHLQKAVALRPDPLSEGNLAFTMHFHPGFDARSIAATLATWNLRHAAPLLPASRFHTNARTPGRKLRIGYVSPDFREHPVGRFMLPLLSHHDRSRFEIACYTDVRFTDALTERLKSFTSLWRDTRELTDAAVADLIRADRIDVLVDLTMHMRGSRLLAFARKPAPVQFTYLAYCSTTGMPAIDYRISDPHLDPPDVDESIYAEKTVRLPHTYWCYPPPDVSPDVNPLPAASNGYITFGCLNAFSKVTEPTLDAWAELLCRVPDSRLILYADEGSHRQRASDALARKQIGATRLTFVGLLPLDRYLEQYHAIDIALDPFPYPGGTTTCDALWMGVPVVSLAGGSAYRRAGASLLTNVGLPELIAASVDQYLDIASALASNHPRLTELRASLRSRLQQSPIMNAPQFAHDVEAIYSTAWNAWREANPADHDRAIEHGNAARERGDIDEAIAAYQLALQDQPASTGAANNLANALWDSARQEEAIPLLRRAAENTDDPAIAGNLLFALNFQPELSPKQILAEHVRWRQRFADPLAADIAPHLNAPSPTRRLRIGYVSADFRNHPVGMFMLPILTRHDKSNFEVFCYSGVETPDLMTQRLKAATDSWRDVAAMSDADLAKLIRADKIDILVDLTLHAQGSRLLAFARKPAPVQVTYLGYAGTTGLATIDYRLTDPYLDPPGCDEGVYTEQSWRLPRTYYGYQPVLQAPPPGPLPALSNGVVTFASLNNFYKVNAFTRSLWRDVLRAVPRSRLLLHATRGSHRARIAEEFAAGGVDASRVGFVDRLPLAQYLQLHQQIDIALDSHPFPGATTTLDALWMGVPVVSLVGQTAVSRAGRSILTNAGLAPLAVDTREMYIQTATKLASELPSLASMRVSLREQLRTSPLLDDVRFARDLESAYRQIWQRWCATR